MTVRDLQIFVMVAECGRMSEAARRLYITQSSVSQAISSIEKEYGIMLFERLSHSLFLTETGRELLAYARNMFAVKTDMEEFLRTESGSRRLRVGATVTVGTCVLSPILLSMRERIPDIDTQVYVANTHILEEMLLSNQIDVGLVEGKVASPDLVSVNAIEDRLVLICSNSHRFHERLFVEAAELSGEPIILREKGSGTRAQFEDQMAERKLSLNVRWNCYNSEAIKNAVMDGHGVSVISERLVREDVAHARLWACDVKDLELRRYFDIVYHKNKYLSETLNAFMEGCGEFAKAERRQSATARTGV